MEREEFRGDSTGMSHSPTASSRPHERKRPPRPSGGDQSPQGVGRPPHHHHMSDTPHPHRPPYHSYQSSQVGTIIHPIPQVQSNIRTAYLRFFNAIIGNITVDVYVDGTLAAQDLTYGNVSSYVVIASNIDMNHTVVVYRSGSKSDPILQTGIPIDRGSVYTGVLGGSLPSIGLQSVAIQRMEIPSQMTILRFDHLSPNNVALDVKLNYQKVFGCVSFWNVTRPIGLYAGIYTIELLPCGSQTPIYTMPSVNIGAGAYTLCGIGLSDGEPPFQGILLKD